MGSSKKGFYPEPSTVNIVCFAQTTVPMGCFPFIQAPRSGKLRLPQRLREKEKLQMNLTYLFTYWITWSIFRRYHFHRQGSTGARWTTGFEYVTRLALSRAFWKFLISRHSLRILCKFVNFRGESLSQRFVLTPMGVEIDRRVVKQYLRDYFPLYKKKIQIWYVICFLEKASFFYLEHFR